MTAGLMSDYWEQRYQEGRTGWDLGRPAPPFEHLLQQDDAPQLGRMAVLGSGRGEDALLFADRGFEVIGFDIAPSAIAVATQAARDRNLAAQFLQRDLFTLDQDFAQQFDFVLEHTCFCAIAPELRSTYVALVHSLLHPAGELIALFWAHNRPGGPPFGSSANELVDYFSPWFDLVTFQKTPYSVDGRKNEEYLARFRAKESRDR